MIDNGVNPFIDSVKDIRTLPQTLLPSVQDLRSSRTMLWKSMIPQNERQRIYAISRRTGPRKSHEPLFVLQRHG